MIEWKPLTKISHLPPMHLTPDQFSAIRIRGMEPVSDRDYPICKYREDNGPWVISVHGGIFTKRGGIQVIKNFYRPVIVVRADMKVAA